MSCRTDPRVPRPPRSARRALAALTALPLLALAALDAGAQARPRPGTLPGQRPTRPTTSDSAPARRRPAAPSAAATPAPAAGTGRVTLRGIVWDSLANAPLPGAVVQVAAADDPARAFSTQSDSLGEFRLRGLAPGRYIAGFFHRTLDGLGLEARPTLLELGAADTLAVLDFGTPGPRAVRASVCSAGDATAPLMVGIVRDAESDAPVEGARVVLTWNETRFEEGGVRNVRRRLPIRARGDGGYVACNLPADAEIEAGAEAPRRMPGGVVTVALPAGAVVRRDFTLGDSGSVTTSSCPTRRRRARAARPCRRAWRAATPPRRRRARARRPPAAGRPAARARHRPDRRDRRRRELRPRRAPLGHLQRRGARDRLHAQARAVDLSARRPAQVAVTLDNRVATLEGVRVTDRAAAETGPLAEFEARRKRGGFGGSSREEEMQQRNAFIVSDALRVIPGCAWCRAGGGTQGERRLGRGGCEMNVFVDGNRMINGASDLDDVVRPQDVAGIEVYNGAAGMPAQFASAGGTVAASSRIWTKRGPPRQRQGSTGRERRAPSAGGTARAGAHASSSTRPGARAWAARSPVLGSTSRRAEHRRGDERGQAEQVHERRRCRHAATEVHRPVRASATTRAR
jgi:hypothetical protein